MLETPNTTGNLIPFTDTSCFDQRWMFGAQIGKDTTNNFAMSVNGLAIRTADNRFIAPTLDRAGNVRITDVTCLTIGIDPWVYRFPVKLDSIEAGNLLIRSDSPFQMVVVSRTDLATRRIFGVDPLLNEAVEIVVPTQELEVESFLVRAVSVFDGFGEIGGGGSRGGGLNSNIANLLPFLLCGNSGNAANSGFNNNLMLAVALGSGGSVLGGNSSLLTLLALQGNSGTNATQAVLLASLLGRRFSSERPAPIAEASPSAAAASAPSSAGESVPGAGNRKRARATRKAPVAKK